MENAECKKMEQAVNELNLAIVNLSKIVLDKREELKQTLNKKDIELGEYKQKVDILKDSSQKVVNNIDLLMGNLNKVLNKNESGNHKN